MESALKFSCYNILFDVEGKHYVYNTLSTALAQLDDKTFNAAKEDDAALVDNQFCEEMLNQHFLVDCQADELCEYLYFYNHIRFGKSAKVLSINFVASYDCNLACPYCLQGHRKTEISIGTKDVDRILAFISNTIEKSIAAGVAITRINTHLYGGEPMLQKPTLIYYSDRLKSIAEKYKCEIAYTMTSNMTLLDDDMVEFMQKYQISVQVSIDGTKEQHDERRIFANGSGTYEIILKNLERLRDAGLKDRITIRLNIDKRNLEDAEKIFTAIYELSDDVYFGFLETFKGHNDAFSNECISNFIYPQIVTDTFNEVYQKYGRVPVTSFGKMAPCAMVCENKFLIDPLLNVYKCEMLLNQPEHRVGFLNSAGQLIKNGGFYKQMNRTPQIFPECIVCKLLPLCAGGCAGKSHFDYGDINKPYCLFSEEALIIFLTDYVKRAAT
jgi:uncharacterized protein